MILNKDQKSFSVTNDKGETIECEILFSFEDAKTGKNYIVYTDQYNEGGITQVLASVYHTDPDDYKLYPIETEEEWKLIENILAKLQEEAKKNRTGSDKNKNDE